MQEDNLKDGHEVGTGVRLMWGGLKKTLST
jgi:hypothetical protein